MLPWSSTLLLVLVIIFLRMMGKPMAYAACMQLHTNFIQALTVLKEKGGKVSELGHSEEKVAGIILSDVKLECKSLVPVSEDDGKSLSADVERHLSLVE